MNIHRRKDKDGKMLSPFYHYRFKYGGKVYRGTTETTDAALARKVMNKRYNEIVENGVIGPKRRADIPTVQKYAQEFLDGYALNKKTRGNDKSIIKNSIKPTFGKKRLDEVTKRFNDTAKLRDRMEAALESWGSTPDRTPTGDMICHLIESFSDGSE